MRNDQLSTVETADVIIVGGGVIGLAIARALNERGFQRITLIERGEIGGEASYAAGGMLAAQAEAIQPDAFFDLSIASRELYPEWADSLRDETGVDVKLERTGTLFLGFTHHDEEYIDRQFQWQSESGLPVERLTSHQVRSLEPLVSPHVVLALRFPLDVQVENRRLVAALLSSLEKRKVRIMSRTPVKSLCIEDGRVTGIETDKSRLYAPFVIVATGAWASFLMTSDSRLPLIRIEPVRGQMLCFEPTERIQHVLYSPRGYIVPRMDGRILVGSTSDHVGFDKNVTAEGIHTILTNALEISPESIGRARFVDAWAGLRPRADDGLPVIGESSETSGLFYATGHYRNGILLAPITGELIADKIANGAAPSLLNAFSPNRFNPVTVG